MTTHYEGVLRPLNAEVAARALLNKVLYTYRLDPNDPDVNQARIVTEHVGRVHVLGPLAREYMSQLLDHHTALAAGEIDLAALQPSTSAGTVE